MVIKVSEFAGKQILASKVEGGPFQALGRITDARKGLPAIDHFAKVAIARNRSLGFIGHMQA